MFQRHIVRAAALAVMASALSGFSGIAPAAENCDRACLSGLVTQYLDALVTHDPSKLPLADNARFVEDSKGIKPGDGLWKSATAKGQFRQDYIDTRKQVAATHATVLEGQATALCSILIHVQDRKIIGVETLVQRVTPDARLQPT